MKLVLSSSFLLSLLYSTSTSIHCRCHAFGTSNRSGSGSAFQSGKLIGGVSSSLASSLASSSVSLAKESPFYNLIPNTRSNNYITLQATSSSSSSTDNDKNEEYKGVDVDNDVDIDINLKPPPFPDTISLNNALHELAKSTNNYSNNYSNTNIDYNNNKKDVNNNNNNSIKRKNNNKINSYMKISTAQKAQDLLFECEHWYNTHIKNGYTIIQSENNNNNNGNQVNGKVIVGPIPDTYSYSSVIDAWAKIGYSDRAIELLEYMYDLDNAQSVASAKAESEAAASTSTNTSTTPTTDQGQKKKQKQKKDRNIKPNTITYNSVINSLCNSIQQGRISNNHDIESTPIKAQELLQEMKNHILHKTNMYCIPDTTTYNTVLKVWSHSMRKDCGMHSEELLNEMWFYHDQYQKHVDGDSCSDSGDDTGGTSDITATASGSTTTKSDASTDNILLNVTPDQFSYSTAISAWARSSLKNNSTSAKKAEKLLEQMEQYRSMGYTHLSPTTYCVNAVLNAWSKISTNNNNKVGVNGAAVRAEKILRRMESLYENGGRDELFPNTISYNTVISAYARSGEVGSERRAERILKRMDKLSQRQQEGQRQGQGNNSNDSNNSCQPDIISYNTVINGWSRSKDPKAPIRAEAILNHMEKQYKNGLSNIQPDVVSYTSCIAAWARRKTNITPDMAHRAQSILDRMDEAYRNGNIKLKPTVLSYNTVCNAWAKSRHDDAANQVLSILEKMEMMHTNGEMYVKPDIFTYTTCIDTLAKQGKRESTEKALELLNIIEKRYNATSDADIKPNVRTYTSVINAISRSKLGPERAEELLTHIEELGKDTNDKDLKIDVVCFNAVLNAWGWSSKPNKAKRSYSIYQKMLELYKSGENKDAKPDLITMNSLLNACAFSNAKDKKESSEAVDIAIEVYEMYQSEAPLYGIPNHLTYGTMLMIFNKLLPQNELRDELMKNVFYQCCENGHLSGFVVSQLQHGFSDKSLKELFGKAAINDGSNIVIDKRKVPRDWSRYAGGRSRPSKKRRSVDVTKRQISRSPIT
jgi:hypothetical protein